MVTIKMPPKTSTGGRRLVRRARPSASDKEEIVEQKRRETREQRQKGVAEVVASIFGDDAILAHKFTDGTTLVEHNQLIIEVCELAQSYSKVTALKVLADSKTPLYFYQLTPAFDQAREDMRNELSTLKIKPKFEGAPCKFCGSRVTQSELAQQRSGDEAEKLVITCLSCNRKTTY